jgi:hypothetical protein
MKTTQPSKLETEAMQLFGTAKVESVSTILWALGLREACGRCGGSGHYSRNSMGDTRCYDCKGRKERAARLTRKTLEQARVKVEAGELVAARARGAAKVAARKAVKVKLAEETAAAAYICDAFTRADLELRPAEREADICLYIPGPMSNARGMSVAVSRHAFETSLAVEFHGMSPVKACAILDACIAMQLELRDAWRAWETAQRAELRASSHARLAA